MDLIDHLKEAVDYMGGRINAVDNKASVIIALQAGLFGVTTFVIEKLYLPCYDLRIISFVCLLIIGSLTAIVVGFLLQVIRPTKNFFSADSGMPELESPKIIWPSMKCKPTISGLMSKFDNYQVGDIEKDLRAAVFACQYMVFRKYWFYRCALRVAKIQLVATFVLLLLIPMRRLI